MRGRRCPPTSIRARSSPRCRVRSPTADGSGPTTNSGACRTRASRSRPRSTVSTSTVRICSRSRATPPPSCGAAPRRSSVSTGATARSSTTVPRRSRRTPTLAVTANVDLVWVDDVVGDLVWGVNPWGIQAIDKNAQGILVLGEDGDLIDEGESGQATAGADDSAASEPEVREPDDNGIDDPPVAVDDPVTARSGAIRARSGDGQRLRPRRRGDRRRRRRGSGPRLGRHRDGDDRGLHPRARLRRDRLLRLHDRRRRRHARNRDR